MTKGVKGNFARAQDELHLGPQFFPTLAQEIHAGIGRKSALTCARPLLPSVMILTTGCTMNVEAAAESPVILMPQPQSRARAASEGQPDHSTTGYPASGL